MLGRCSGASTADLPVMMISGHGTIDTAVSAIKSGAYDFIEKPFKADRLLLVVDRAIEADRLRRENEELRLRAGGEIELSASRRRSISVRQLDRAGGADRQPRADHRPRRRRQGGGRAADPCRARSRADGPFVVRQLRDHAAGAAGDRAVRHRARTGRRLPRRSGTFELAHGGTLLLDEVADMPLEIQGKMARVLQEQTFARVGGKTRVEVDVRVHRLDQPRPAGGDRGRPLPRGALPPPERRADPRAAAERAPRGYPAAGPSLHDARPPMPPACPPRESARTRWRPCRPTTGRATSASCATSSSGC